MTHVFISYVRENVEEVDRLAKILRAFEVKVWLDRDSITPGQKWKVAIRQAIQEGSFFVACFSAQYHGRSRTHMNEELLLAIQELRLRPHDKAWFIPIRLDDTSLPEHPLGPGETLADIQAVSMHPVWEDGARRLLDVVRPESGTVYQLMRKLEPFSLSSDRDRSNAVEKLGELGSLAASAAPALRWRLSREEDYVAARAIANALYKIGAYDSTSVRDLVRSVWAAETDTSYAALALGPKAIPVLEGFIADDGLRLAEADRLVRHYYAGATEKDTNVASLRERVAIGLADFAKEIINEICRIDARGAPFGRDRY